MPISMIAASFGVSRPAFYKAQQDFAREGLAGLIARRRGPKQGHKLTGEVPAFVEHIRAQEPGVTTPELVRRTCTEQFFGPAAGTGGRDGPWYGDVDAGGRRVDRAGAIRAGVFKGDGQRTAIDAG